MATCQCGRAGGGPSAPCNEDATTLPSVDVFKRSQFALVVTFATNRRVVHLDVGSCRGADPKRRQRSRGHESNQLPQSRGKRSPGKKCLSHTYKWQDKSENKAGMHTMRQSYLPIQARQFRPARIRNADTTRQKEAWIFPPVLRLSGGCANDDHVLAFTTPFANVVLCLGSASHDLSAHGIRTISSSKQCIV